MQLDSSPTPSRFRHSQQRHSRATSRQQRRVTQANAPDIFQESKRQTIKRLKETVKFSFVTHTSVFFPSNRDVFFNSRRCKLRAIGLARNTKNFTITDSKQIAYKSKSFCSVYGKTILICKQNDHWWIYRNCYWFEACIVFLFCAKSSRGKWNIMTVLLTE